MRKCHKAFVIVMSFIAIILISTGFLGGWIFIFKKSLFGTFSSFSGAGLSKPLFPWDSGEDKWSEGVRKIMDLDSRSKHGHIKIPKKYLLWDVFDVCLSNISVYYLSIDIKQIILDAECVRLRLNSSRKALRNCWIKPMLVTQEGNMSREDDNLDFIFKQEWC